MDYKCHCLSWDTTYFRFKGVIVIWNKNIKYKDSKNKIIVRLPSTKTGTFLCLFQVSWTLQKTSSSTSPTQIRRKKRIHCWLCQSKVVTGSDHWPLKPNCRALEVTDQFYQHVYNYCQLLLSMLHRKCNPTCAETTNP